jgi:hypothetical protein
MKARLAVGLGVVAALVLLVALLLREETPRGAEATPVASATEQQLPPSAVVERPEEALVVEQEAQPPSEPQLASPPPSDATPRDVDPLERDAEERLPEGWTPPPEEFGSVTVLVTSTPGRKPVEGVLVWLETDFEVGLYEMPEPGYSDAEGKVTFERTPVGLVRAWTAPVGTTPEIPVKLGELSTATVSLSSLRTVEGVVLTHSGQPAEGAEVWRIGLSVDHDVPRPIARSDASGHFKFWMNARDAVGLCARRGDELPSNVVGVPGNSPGTTERAEFVLGPNGKTLKVRVAGPRGEQIGNASVWISCGASRDLWQSLDTGARTSSFANLWCSTTDQNGIATVEGLPRACLDLVAVADGYDTKRVTIRLPHPEDPVTPFEVFRQELVVKDGQFDLALKRGVALEGQVFLPDGSPAVRAAVRHGEMNMPGSVTTYTDKDGYFRLHGVSAQACQVQAVLGEHRAQIYLPTVAEGTTRWWSPVLYYSPR